MSRSGFSLIETIVAVAIAAIVMTFATINFRQYLQNYRSAQQMRFLRGELMKARLAAVTQQRDVLVHLYSDHFEVYSSSVVDTAPRLVTVTYPVTWNLGSMNLKFDEKGLANIKGCICIDGDKGTGGVDSIVLSPTRIALGKIKPGGTCNDESITIK